MSPNPSLHPDAAVDLARRVAQSMFERDTASQGLGIRIEDIGPGTARLSMVVRGDMLNGHHICHGGFMFTLADSAFAFACNSRNEATVAAGCSIEFLRPVQLGETLTAVAQERVLSGRTGIYDITVVDQSGQAVAVFRGKSARIKGEVLPAT
ncbi:hydroxyphenylacetyl-CoA thioesterase PaaI [Panacagrimonas sp.]|uniref:hydroxyphenylacetyl-CoA thioesterase PaaI n=1 Tax=Panacagrimonas sp. TaxID=2480088 RepID=UPI003B51E163